MVGRIANWRAGWSVALAMTAGLYALEAESKVARAPLAEVVAGALVIVVAKDVAVREIEGARIGEAVVERVLKGDPDLKEVLYLADPTWICDIAEAKVGE